MSEQIITIAVYAVLLLIAGYFVNSWLEDLKTEREKQGALALANDTNMTEEGVNTVLNNIPQTDLAKARADLNNWDVKPVAQMIKDANGYTNDDEDGIYTAFSIIGTKLRLAYLSLYFKKVYKQELFIFLQSFLDLSELNNINNIVKKFKPY